MATCHWHKLYAATVAAPADLLFRLLSDLPNYGDWLPGSSQYAGTNDVEPYPVRRGTRYHDGKPDEPGKDWWGTVTGFQPPGSLDFHHTIHAPQVRATIDVHIHYSLEPAEADAGARETQVTQEAQVTHVTQITQISRWLVLDITMPLALRPLRPLITARFDKENQRTIAALRAYAEAHSAVGG